MEEEREGVTVIVSKVRMRENRNPMDSDCTSQTG